MKKQKVDILRILLPSVQHAQRPYLALYYHAQRWHPVPADSSWESLAQHYAPKRLQLGLHPQDFAITQLTLPPLPAAKLTAAVREQVALLSLQDTQTLSITHSPPVGPHVTLSWTPLSTLQHWAQLLAQYRFKSLLFYPVCAFLPDDMTQTPMGDIDTWSVLRSQEHNGVIVPPLPSATQAEIRAHIETHYPQLTPFQWLPRRQYDTWTGKAWSWHFPLHKAQHKAYTYYPALLLWGTIISAIWLSSVHLYAQQLSQSGQTLKRQMSQAVQAAYPQLSVVLNPLQQVRQMQAAAPSALTPPPANYPQLIQSVAPLLDPLQAQIQSLHYKDGTLRLRLRPAAGLKQHYLQTLQQQAQEQGLQLHDDNTELTIRAAPSLPASEGQP